MSTKPLNRFDRFNGWMNNVEGSAVNTAATIVPWITPIAPMVMTFNHAVAIFGGGVWGIVWAVPIAATVELLGFATVATLVRFWTFNKKKNVANYKKAPTWAPFLAFVFYLALILTVNVMLDLGAALGWNDAYVQIAARGMFTLLTIPGAVIVAVRAAHREALTGSMELFGTGTTSTSNPTPSSTSTPTSTGTKVPKAAKKRNQNETQIYNYMQTVFVAEQGRIAGYKDALDYTQLPPATVSRVRTKWIAEELPKLQSAAQTGGTP